MNQNSYGLSELVNCSLALIFSLILQSDYIFHKKSFSITNFMKYNFNFSKIYIVYHPYVAHSILAIFGWFTENIVQSTLYIPQQRRCDFLVRLWNGSQTGATRSQPSFQWTRTQFVRFQSINERRDPQNRCLYGKKLPEQLVAKRNTCFATWRHCNSCYTTAKSQ